MTARQLLAATISGHLVYPERASPRVDKKIAFADRYMAATAHPKATEAALDVLRDGGTAADAAIAASLVLAVVEPQSTGLAGGGYALVRHPVIGLFGLDGREMAPRGADANLFSPDGKPLAPEQAVQSGRSIGTPGLVPMLETLHQRAGRLDWAALVEPARLAARDGFRVSARLEVQITSEFPRITDLRLRRLLLNETNHPLRAGDIMRQPDLAEVLACIGRTGSAALRRGEIARQMVEAARAAPYGSQLSAADLDAYAIEPAMVVAGSYRGHKVAGLAGSTAGGPSLLQILGLLERFDLSALDPEGPDAAHLIAEASNHAFADRFAFLGDTEASRARIAALLNPAYIAQRAARIDPATCAGVAPPGDPSRTAARPLVDEPSTTHLSIVDQDGMAVSMTHSVGLVFGAQVSACGMILNNQLIAFGPPSSDGTAVNEPAAGRRPLSSMAPTMVFDAGGEMTLCTGSPGSSAIIGYTAKSLLGVLDWGLDVQSAVDLPNVLNRNGPTELELGTSAEALAPALNRRGHDCIIVPLASGIHAIARVDGSGWAGGVDPRRDGVALGD
jgi:gamma-glutamyltranspeptidase/glutathione hydrolase